MSTVIAPSKLCSCSSYSLTGYFARDNVVICLFYQTVLIDWSSCSSFSSIIAWTNTKDCRLLEIIIWIMVGVKNLCFVVGKLLHQKCKSEVYYKHYKSPTMSRFKGYVLYYIIWRNIQFKELCENFYWHLGFLSRFSYREFLIFLLLVMLFLNDERVLISIWNLLK